MTLVQAKVIYTPPLFYAAKGLWYIKLKFHCNSKSVRKRKRLDFLTDLKLSDVCTNLNHKGLQRTANEYAEERRIYKDLISKNDK